MFRFWDIAIAPTFDAANARRVVEIGALKGEMTVLMLKRLGADAELHVIDPVPSFDPSEHEQDFPGQYIFHRDLSHNVLPHLPVMDVALVDGDHNWYTVYHELKMLSDVARAADAPMPVLLMHDVCWPYGRRDLYYSPETIPEEFRQPYEQAGMIPGRKKLALRGGGINPTMYNAVVEGGPRNGVMTALDDFVEEYDKPLRRVVLPIYWGLALVAEEERLRAQPALAEVFDWLESDEGRGQLLNLAEETRLQATLGQHQVFFQREKLTERSAKLYLGLLKGALLDEHYLENELRITILSNAIDTGRGPELDKLRDPRNNMSYKFGQLLADRRAGKLDGDTGSASAHLAYTTMGRVRLDRLQDTLDTIRTESVVGDLVDCGVGRGGGAVFMRGYLETFSIRDRKVWVATAFGALLPEAPDAATPSGALNGGFYMPGFQPDLNTVRSAFDVFDLLDEQVAFLQGPPGDTLPTAPIDKVALLRVGADVADGSVDSLEALYDRVTLGGFVVIDDYGTPERQKAVDEFRQRRGIEEPIERLDWNAVRWRKLQHVPAATSPTEPAIATQEQPRTGPPLAPPPPAVRKDLSVVVVFYNMKREAERTLHALTRAYQQGIDDLDYEIIAIENGSAEDQKLGAEYVQSFGPEFRYVDMGSEATPSPVTPMNRGIAMAAGDAVALMIDGAHVLTPGVLRFGMAGLETYEPSVVVTQQWYVGPGQQPEMVNHGYDQAYEDELFEAISWPKDGYRLFEVGNFVGDRDWFDGQWESNCIFVPRWVLEQCGGFEEGFAMPGGGYANLDIYERIGATPNVDVVALLGEGSFHQVHGGTTTNEGDAEARSRKIASYADSYVSIRGAKAFVGSSRPIHYVGTMRPVALRSKARRPLANHFWKPRSREQGGIPSKPSPIPDQLTEQYVESTWESLAWRKTKWLGRTVPRYPTDLFVYQEVVERVRPDWIIETGTKAGGRAFFLASICDLLDHGQVISIDSQTHDDRPEHPRIRYLTGKPLDEAVLGEVRRLVGDEAHGLVISGIPSGANRMVEEFDAYSDFVSVGSYVIVEDTIFNGHPVWPTFGPGPMEAVKRLVNRRANFAPDAKLEKFGITFSPNGFLKRLR